MTRPALCLYAKQAYASAKTGFSNPVHITEGRMEPWGLQQGSFTEELILKREQLKSAECFGLKKATGDS